nr:hypothetical protein [Ruegeria sp. HKCCA0235A]
MSASVPRYGRAGSESFDPYLIKEAVTALIEVILGRYLLVWGGQPAITPIVAASSEGYDVSFSGVATLYQSAYFRKDYPSENQKFENFVETDEIRGNKAASLTLMRKQMLTSHEFFAGVFIGGMEGVVEEYEMFKKLHPLAIRLPIPSPGGTSQNLFKREEDLPEQLADAVDFPFWFQKILNVDLSTPRSYSLKSG